MSLPAASFEPVISYLNLASPGAEIRSGKTGNSASLRRSGHTTRTWSGTDDASVLAADPNKDLHQIRCLEMMSLYYVLSTICFKHENVWEGRKHETQIFMILKRKFCRKTIYF